MIEARDHRARRLRLPFARARAEARPARWRFGSGVYFASSSLWTSVRRACAGVARTWPRSMASRSASRLTFLSLAAALIER